MRVGGCGINFWFLRPKRSQRAQGILVSQEFAPPGAKSGPSRPAFLDRLSQGPWHVSWGAGGTVSCRDGPRDLGGEDQPLLPSHSPGIRTHAL